MVSAFLAAAALVGVSPGECPATIVRYQSAKHPTLGDAPWVLATPRRAGVAGFLVSYPPSLRAEEVNGSDGLVLWRTGAKIVWNTSGSLVARRLDGPGAFRLQLTAGSGGAMSVFRFPATGCWRLNLHHEGKAASVVARVVRKPAGLACHATELESGDVFARPRSSGIRGPWPWQSAGPATLTTHGHDGDRNMKVPWRVRGKWGPLLTLTGTRLDGKATFRQDFHANFGTDGQVVYPSIVDIPVAGCWLLRLRTAGLAGVIVVRAVDSG
jgi:hypothetical protein